MNDLSPTVSTSSATIDRAALLAAVDVACNVIDRRPSDPILANVRLCGSGRSLTVSGTNQGVQIDVSATPATNTALNTTVPAHLLRDLLKGAPKCGDLVQLTLTEPKTLAADFGKATYELAALDSEPMPELRAPSADADDYRKFVLDSSELYSAMDSVKFAISTEETRYYLNGIFMHAVGTDYAPELRFVATDGHRLARQSMPMPEGAGGSGASLAVIIPRFTVALLLKMLKPVRGAEPIPVCVEISGARLRFKFGSVTITSKAIDGAFPDYERVIPKNNDKCASVDVDALLNALKAVSLIADDKKNSKAVLAFAGMHLTVRSAADGAKAKSAIALDAPGAMPETFEIGFNNRYLAESVSEAKADGLTVDLAFNDAGGPAVITGARPGWVGVLMPVRT